MNNALIKANVKSLFFVTPVETPNLQRECLYPQFLELKYFVPGTVLLGGQFVSRDGTDCRISRRVGLLLVSLLLPGHGPISQVRIESRSDFHLTRGHE